MDVNNAFIATSSNDENSFLIQLILFCFIFYIAASILVAAYRGGLFASKERAFSSLVALILLVWIFGSNVIDFISPALLRLFGVGGQGYLHLLSLWFVDVRDLTLFGIVSRVAAGLYSSILSAVFGFPLLLAVSVYIINVYEAFEDGASRGNAQSSEVPYRAEKVLNMNNNNNSSNNEEHGERFLLTEFDMTAFQTLCVLGKGVTSQVVLAKVIHNKEKDLQPGNLWDASLPHGPSSTTNGNNNNNQTNSNLWDITNNNKNNHRKNNNSQLSVTMMASPQLSLTAATAAPSSIREGGNINRKISVMRKLSLEGDNSSTDSLRNRSFHDALLDVVETDTFYEKSISNHAKQRIGPGGGAGMIAGEEGGVNQKRIGPGGGHMDPPPQQQQQPPPSPFLHASKSDLSMKQLMKNSKSMTALSELAGVKDTEEEGNWRQIQWLNKEQRDATGMDNDFVVAPGLAHVNSVGGWSLDRSSQKDLSELALDRIANLASNPSVQSLALLNSGLPRDSSALNVIVLNTTRKEGSVAHLQQLQQLQQQAGDGGETNSQVSKQKSVKFDTKTSLISSTEEDMMSDFRSEDFHGENNLVDESAMRNNAGLEEMPELVAIKIMKKSEIERMGMKKTVENERKALAICASPFICNIFGAFQDSKWAYLLLEPVPAGDLAGLLEQKQIMSEEEAKFYIGCLLLALEHLHHRGITCLDVKPENMLLDQWGYAKLCDLGIAKTVRDQTTRWEFIGTPEYMSPEVINKEVIAPGVTGVAGPDIWAVGILFFELLAGTTPFYGETNSEVISQIQRYCQDDLDIRNSKLRAYQRWTARANDTAAEEEMNLLSLDFHRALFSRIQRKSKLALELAKRLLRPEPTKRLGCVVGGASMVMTHSWFKDFDFEALRKRQIKSPFIPNPLTLAPMFRGEDVQVDIVRKKPLNLEELRRCQNILRHGNPSIGGGGEDSGKNWKGFIVIGEPVPQKTDVDILPHARELLATADD